MDCFIDSNVWLYIFIEGQDENKARQARMLLDDHQPAVSTQIVNEICVNLLRQTDFSESAVRALVASFYGRYPVSELTERVMRQASELRGRYAFSFWDSMVVSCALKAGVDTLYSEDMQDGLVVEERLTITNPF